MKYDLKEIKKLALGQYRLTRQGIHGTSHWLRVKENGLRLAKRTGADRDVVVLFSLLHDCCRRNDGRDIEHGPRAACFVETLIGKQIQGDQQQVEQLMTSIRDHTSKLHTDDVTIGTCWDADRLDIGRIGITPDRRFLNTDAAKDNTLVSWAFKRSRAGRSLRKRKMR